MALLLLERGADVNRPNQQTGCTMLLLACQKGYTDVVRLCLERGADVHQMDASGQPPLAIVCKGGHRDSARLCLAHGADVDQVDYLGMGPLHYACIYNRHDAVRGILDHGAAVDGASPQQTPLWVTCCAVTNHWVGVSPNFAKTSTACSGAPPLHAAHKEFAP